MTGATGFIGRRLVALLVDEGWDVHAVVRPTSRRDGMPGDVVPHVDDGSLRAIELAVEEAAPSVCFHLAGLFIGTHEPSDVPELIGANVAFPARLAEALSRPTAPLLVNSGTFWQHVDGEPYRPAALYAATKQAAEDILRYYCGVEQLRVVTLKLHDSYGPDDTRPKLVNVLVNAAATGEQLQLTAGEQYIDLVHVDDVARAFLAAAEQFLDAPTPLFKSFSVSSGAPLRLRDLAAQVQLVTKRPLHAAWGARPYRRHEMFEPWDTGLRLPSWEPAVSLKEGLTALWLRPGAAAKADSVEYVR